MTLYLMINVLIEGKMAQKDTHRTQAPEDRDREPQCEYVGPLQNVLKLGAIVAMLGSGACQRSLGGINAILRRLG
jgi:hypothetical protein